MERFIIMRSTNDSAPCILGVKNTYNEAEIVMMQDFIKIGDLKPMVYAQYTYGAKALHCIDDRDYRWSIEKIETEDKNKILSTDDLPDEIVAVIFNWKGLKEENYLFTLDDFVKFVGNDEDADNIVHKITEMRSGEKVDFAFAANKTFEAWIINKKESKDINEDLYAFLNGNSNDDAMQMLINNYDEELSPLENIEQWNDWYYDFNAEESSKEIVDIIKSNPILCRFINKDGGYIPRPYISVLESILNIFKEEEKAYKDISKVINDFNMLNDED